MYPTIKLPLKQSETTHSYIVVKRLGEENLNLVLNENGSVEWVSSVSIGAKATVFESGKQALTLAELWDAKALVLRQTTRSEFVDTLEPDNTVITTNLSPSEQASIITRMGDEIEGV